MRRCAVTLASLLGIFVTVCHPVYADTMATPEELDKANRIYNNLATGIMNSGPDTSKSDVAECQTGAAHANLARIHDQTIADLVGSRPSMWCKFPDGLRS